ncbi:hypothetical protein D3C76_163510 [compost metagenome]
MAKTLMKYVVNIENIKLPEKGGDYVVQLLKLLLYLLGSMGMLYLIVYDFIAIQAKKQPIIFKKKLLLGVIFICYIFLLIGLIVDLISYIDNL